MKNSNFRNIRVFAPASVSNLNCGFDVLGFALDQPGDEVVLTLDESQDVHLDTITGDDGKLPKEVHKNTASAVIQLYLQQIGIRQGVGVQLHKNMPLNSGLGSSAASSVAALVAINSLMGEPLSREQLLPLAMEGERLACGNAHADNVAPALFGGLVLIRGGQQPEIVALPIPKNLWCAVVHPDVHIPTREARQILPEMVPLKDATLQWGNLAGFLAGLYNSDFELMGRSMVDVIVEPHRSARIPFFDAMRQKAHEKGAFAFGISGSGPTVFAFCDSHHKAQQVTQQLTDLLLINDISNQGFVSPINTAGAVVKELW